ncbi:MAG: family 78 glycoside hydrolase catalytic domain [Tannerella sp.]|nr:family 78 glycoside hydrolase catalytic domain [Tannerella sp.]
MTDPLSVNVDNPRLGWVITTLSPDENNIKQTAYQVIASSSQDLLDSGVGDLWDSGKVKSSQSAQVVYGGKRPDDMRRCYWKVRIWTNRGVSPWSATAFWGAGIASSDRWQASWIGDQPDMQLRDYKKYVETHYREPDFDRERWMNPPYTPSPLLRKSFNVSGEVVRATLYASAIGYYEMWLNGSRIGEQMQAPEWTKYDDYVQYQTFDLTSELRKGANVLSATLADGWALGRMGGIKWNLCFPHRGFYALDRRLIAQLVIEMADSSTVIIPTDETWKILTDGYILMADNFWGETIDASKIPSGWQQVGFDDSLWQSAYVDNEPEWRLTAQVNEPIRVHAELKPVKIWPWRDKYIADFGQNIAGHCRLKIKGKAGQTVTLRHGEWLNSDGSIYTQSLGHARATDTFILSGNDDIFDPSFTYHGFQYVEISGVEKDYFVPRNDVTETRNDGVFDITAIAVSSDPAITGAFECSNPDLNRLYANILWTQRNNMFSVMTDNPSRDERTGATGDIQIFAQSAIFNMNMAGFFTKFVNDSHDIAPNGQFFSMIPSLRQPGFWDGFIGAPGWCEAGLIIPWRMYENYGDRRALESLYPAMKHHIEATLRENPDLVWRVRHNHNNDWLNANTIANPPDPTYSTKRGGTPDDVFATAFFAYSTRLLADIAQTLGNKDDARRYGNLADSIKAKFISLYVDAEGHVEGDSQGAYSLALNYDLIPANLRKKAFGHLVACIEEYDYRLSTGFISTPMMMQLLVDFGRTDIAYRLLESERFPSWLYPIKNGATTMWERWDAWVPGRGFQSAGMNSLDHFAFGSVGEWLFRHILGINPDIQHPGYEHFTLQPRVGGSLTWTKGSYRSIRGEIGSAWRLENDVFTLEATIPPNTTATVILPDGSKHTKGSGRYTFTISYKQPNSLRIVQLCDPQLGFGKDGFAADSARFELAVRKVNALAPDVAVIAGDMVNDITDSHAIDVFLKIKAKLKCRTVATPGNHDLPDPVTEDGLKRYRSYFGNDFSVTKIKGVTLISANTQLWRGAPEKETERQEQQLLAALKEAKSCGDKVIMITHVPPFVKSADEEDQYFNIPSEKRAELLKNCADYGVIIWLSGHTHNTHRNDYDGLSILNGETTSNNFDEHPYGFRLLTLQTDGSFDWDFIPLNDTDVKF